MWQVCFCAVSVAALVAVRLRRRRPRVCFITGPSNANCSIRPARFIDDVEVNFYTNFEFHFAGVVVDGETLKAGLKRALEVFPLAGGRFVRSSSKAGARWDIAANGGEEGGIEFSQIEVTTNFSFESMSSLDSPNVGPGLAFAQRVFSLPFPEEINETLPLVKVQLAICSNNNEDGGEQSSVISISLSHFLFDGTSRFHFCRTISQLCNPATPTTAHSITNEIAMCEQTYARKLEEHKRDFSPYHLQKRIGGSGEDEHIPVQYLITKQALLEAKRACGGEHCTTHQVIVSLLLYYVCRRTIASRILLFNICNLRTRLPHIFPENYSGNAAGTVLTELDGRVLARGDEEEDEIDGIARVCTEVHATAKSRLGSTKVCEQSFFENEAYGNLVLDRNARQRVMFYRVYEKEDCTSFLINSWRHFDWYSLDFGCGARPARVGLQPTLSTQARYVHIEECNARGDIRLFAMLRPKEVQALDEGATRWMRRILAK